MTRLTVLDSESSRAPTVSIFAKFYTAIAARHAAATPTDDDYDDDDDDDNDHDDLIDDIVQRISACSDELYTLKRELEPLLAPVQADFQLLLNGKFFVLLGYLNDPSTAPSRSYFVRRFVTTLHQFFHHASPPLPRPPFSAVLDALHDLIDPPLRTFISPQRPSSTLSSRILTPLRSGTATGNQADMTRKAMDPRLKQELRDHLWLAGEAMLDRFFPALDSCSFKVPMRMQYPCECNARRTVLMRADQTLSHAAQRKGGCQMVRRVLCGLVRRKALSVSLAKLRQSPADPRSN
jgi:hypothetical protein